MGISVLLSATSYPSSMHDWKGLFIKHLVEALARCGNLEVSAWLPPGELVPNIAAATTTDDEAWLYGLMREGGIAHLVRTRPARGALAGMQLLSRLRRAYNASPAQLFHVNWLQNALPLPHDGRPALVSALGTDMQLLRLPGMRALLRRAFRGRRVLLCPNAEWMVAPLHEAFGDIARVLHIPFGVDASWYGITRAPAEDAPPRWLCVSRLTAGKLGPLFEWGEAHFADGTRELHLFGPRQEQGIAIPAWVHYHGPARPAQLSRDWFPTATGLLSLSRHAEGRPQVMLEAMASGLPILASRLSAHADLLEHGRTGWLCDDPVGFAQGIAALEQTEQNLAMGVCARDTAKTCFGDWDDCALRYVRAYRSLLEANP